LDTQACSVLTRDKKRLVILPLYLRMSAWSVYFEPCFKLKKHMPFVSSSSSFLIFSDNSRVIASKLNKAANVFFTK